MKDESVFVHQYTVTSGKIFSFYNWYAKKQLILIKKKLWWNQLFYLFSSLTKIIDVIMVGNYKLLSLNKNNTSTDIFATSFKTCYNESLFWLLWQPCLIYYNSRFSHLAILWHFSALILIVFMSIRIHVRSGKKIKARKSATFSSCAIILTKRGRIEYFSMGVDSHRNSETVILIFAVKEKPFSK